MTKQKAVYLLIAFLIVATIVATLKHTKESPVLKKDRTSLHLPPSIEATVFKTKDGHWGYEVSISNQRFISQENIPGIPGNKPFKSQTDAFNCSKLVVEKLKKRKSPTITLAEIDSLHISY